MELSLKNLDGIMLKRVFLPVIDRNECPIQLNVRNSSQGELMIQNFTTYSINSIDLQY
uniref:Uncharacterized protein n=1 Tax=Lepeophtheirus salmonis TaxID=72036 RepID=A0A0K2UVD0_LEPSM